MRLQKQYSILLIFLLSHSFVSAQLLEQWLNSSLHKDQFLARWNAIPDKVNQRLSEIRSVDMVWSSKLRTEWERDSVARVFKCESEVRINAWRDLIFEIMQDSMATLKKEYYAADTLDIGFERDLAKRVVLVKARTMVERYPSIEQKQLEVWLDNWVLMRLDAALSSEGWSENNSEEISIRLHQKLATAMSDYVLLQLQLNALMGVSQPFPINTSLYFSESKALQFWNEGIRCKFCSKVSFDDAYPILFSASLWNIFSQREKAEIDARIQQLAFYEERDSLLEARFVYEKTEADSMVARLITYFRNSYELSFFEQDAVWQSKFDRARSASERISIAEQRENWALNFYNDSESLLRELIPGSGFLKKSQLLLNHSKQAGYLRLRDIQEEKTIAKQKQVAQNPVENWSPKEVFDSFKGDRIRVSGYPLLLFKRMI